MPRVDWSGVEGRLSEMGNGGWEESLEDVRRYLRGWFLALMLGVLFWVGIFFVYFCLVGT